MLKMPTWLIDNWVVFSIIAFMNKAIILLGLLLIIPIYAQAQSHLHLEKEYQDVWCKANNGEMEVVLPDNARVDCVTPTHAIEFDFAQKWGESIGQALYYGVATHKQPGIVLIMENGTSDQKYLNRVNAVAKQHNITVWTITPEYLQKK